MESARSQSPSRVGPGGPTVGGGTGVAGDPSHSAADVRRTIVVLLGDGKKMTPDEVEKAITSRLPAARHGVVTSQLRVLQDGRYVQPVKDDSRQLTLTATGRRWLSGIRALSG